MTATPHHPIEHPEALRVSTIELFFDLVFVFTITQITHLVEHAHTRLDFLLALFVLILIWWMYAAYAWLANSVGEQRSLRPVLIAAMAGFLVMALAIPRIFEADGLAFGIAYLFVVVLHLVTFAVREGRRAARSILAIAPFNLGTAALVIVAGIIDAEWDWLLFTAGIALFILSTLFRSYRGFSVNPAYFAERHGLLIILALGESVISIGVGAAELALDLQAIFTIALSLFFLAALWWSYFDHDDERAEKTMLAASPEERSRLALMGYGYTHLVMIFGIVLIATGIKQIVAHNEEKFYGEAWLLASGLAVYLLGDVLFRWQMKIGPVAIRAAGIILTFIVALAGLWWGGIAELITATLLMVVLLLIEGGMER